MPQRMIIIMSFAIFLFLFLSGAPEGMAAKCGDADGDGSYSIGDAVYMINYIFNGGPPPDSTCCDECTQGQSEPCYSGPPATEGVGICQSGTRTCNNGEWEPCTGEVLPQTEVCDGLDNDCDGNVDEGDPGGGGACNTGQPGVCASGTFQCQNGALVCVSNQSPSAEVCDGLDNDCDGSVDEGDPGGGGACNTGQPGVCASGTFQCQNGALVCVPDQSPSAEVCDDGLDNDCDGATDGDDPDCQ